MDFTAQFTTQLAQFNPDPALEAWLLAQFSQSQKEAAKVPQMAAEIKFKDIKINALTFELATMKRLKFGAKTEAYSVDQRELFTECVDADLSAMQAELEQLTPAAPRAKAKPTGRKALPFDLPRIEHRHEPESCNCGQCGNALVQISEDISEQLDVEPARFFVHRHIRPQYACRACETVTAAAIPPAIIDGGLAAPGLHAWVVIQKYLDHLPLYRIEQISARHGAGISRSTLADWIGRIGVALHPLVDRLIELLKERSVLHADETPVQQLDPGKGKTKRAYLWAYRSNSLDEGPPIVVFEFQPGRSGSHARTFLTDWRGHLMVDDYSGYKALFGHGIVELACLAHARRKFFDLHAANQHPTAADALARIAELYHIESTAKDYTVEQRAQCRREQAVPRLEAMHAWLLLTRQKTADGSGLAKAIDYSLKRWPAIMRYAASGNLPIDNNPIENAIRPIAIGKKNWLFAGSERAGKRAAAIQSLLATAKANNIEPLAWLKDTLEKLPTCKNNRIDELLPLRLNSSNH
ncbi:IS66 family transposase [Undibacterium sp. SXout20W]|uniref:IS66 family transposase n=1 Tax=Undibacterium sp. SXout20W TaxID=3413051 RepID=UPI003BF2F2DF